MEGKISSHEELFIKLVLFGATACLYRNSLLSNVVSINKKRGFGKTLFLRRSFTHRNDNKCQLLGAWSNRHFELQHDQCNKEAAEKKEEDETEYDFQQRKDSSEGVINRNQIGTSLDLPRANSFHNVSRKLPRRIILIRHGQSEGNVNQELFSTKPDRSMQLTSLGWQQAKEAGINLKNLLGHGENESIHFILSPYTRTLETFHGIVSAWSDPHQFDYLPNETQRLTAWYDSLNAFHISSQEDPRIREQDFGNFQDPERMKLYKQERHKFGSFYYRFPHGESGADVYDRVSTFLDSLWRQFAHSQHSDNYVLITHGISIRVFLTRYFHYTIEEFHMLANPTNCETVVLTNDGTNRFQLDGRYEIMVDKEKPVREAIQGIKFHKRLKRIPNHLIKKRNARMFDDKEFFHSMADNTKLRRVTTC